MPFEFNLDVRELEQYSRKLTSLPAVIDSAADGVLRKYGGLIAKEARRIVPKDTHNLEKSIRYSPSEKNVVAEMPYAGFVEFGTVKMAPQPYMRPATNKYRKPFRQELVQLGAGLLGTKKAALGALQGAVPQFTQSSALPRARGEV